LKQQWALRGRKELEAKMAIVSGEKIRRLSAELQKTFLDDIVPTFDNSLKVLNNAQSKRGHESQKGIWGNRGVEN
jgi:hypothetical protein